MLPPMLCSDFDDHSTDVLSDLEAGKYWFMQPKIDGVRAVLSKDGFFTRTGNRVMPNLHAELTGFFRSNPDLVLDGELFWRDTPDLPGTVSAIREDDGRVQFFAFDVINQKIQFERLALIQELIMDEEIALMDNATAPVCAVGTIKLRDSLSVDAFFDNIAIKFTHEGVVLRNPHSFYKHRRSKDVLKFKFQGEADVIIESIKFTGNRPVSAVVSPLKSKSFPISTTVSGTSKYWQSQDYIGKQGVIRFGYSGQGEPRDPVLICVRNYD